MRLGVWLWVIGMLGCAHARPAESTSPRESAATPGTAATGDEIPMTPGRGEIQAAIVSVSPSVERCLAGYRGHQVVAAITLASSGEVTSVLVEPPDPASAADGGPSSDLVVDEGTGACVVAAVSGMRVSPFRRSTFLVRFPFRAR